MWHDLNEHATLTLLPFSPTVPSIYVSCAVTWCILKLTVEFFELDATLSLFIIESGRAWNEDSRNKNSRIRGQNSDDPSPAWWKNVAWRTFGGVERSRIAG
jgi:hypothetical protein